MQLKHLVIKEAAPMTLAIEEAAMAQVAWAELARKALTDLFPMEV